MQEQKNRDQNNPDNLAVLGEVVRNTEMGKNTLDELLQITEDREFKASLLNQQREYRKFNQEAHTALAACGSEAKGEGKMKKMMADMGIKYKTMNDHSTRTMAEMIVEGANMGVISCEKTRTEHPQASVGAMQMLDSLQHFEQTTAEEMKRYL